MLLQVKLKEDYGGAMKVYLQNIFFIRAKTNISLLSMIAYLEN